ncbi:hypothetical protein JL722_15177 [Aureococcus anophagefferens]|nr:hypothetical protein JL722_15177 [Aureococcus anophagefferens]
MAAMRLLVLAALGAVGAVELGKTTYNLNLIVERGEFEKTLADAQALLEETKRKKMGVAVQLLLRSAADKITKSFEELEKRRADEAKAEAKASAAEAARPYEAPTTLTNASVGASGKLTDALKKPMILEGALGNRDALRESFHAARLMEDPAFSDVRIEYVTPAVARSKRTFEEQDASAPQEYEHTAISLERYFVNCFNLRAKPLPRGGGQTEHCEQDLAFGSVAGANASGILGSPLAERARAWTTTGAARPRELVEDLGLGGSKMRYAEGTQEPGDVLFMPPDTVHEPDLRDAVSVRGLAGAHEAAYTTDAKLDARGRPHPGERRRGGVLRQFGVSLRRGRGRRGDAGDAHPRPRRSWASRTRSCPRSTARPRRATASPSALADCAGYAAVAGSIKGSQCEVHAAACARVLGLDGAPWLADLLSGMFVKKRDW